jgi:hypothetical protein
MLSLKLLTLSVVSILLILASADSIAAQEFSVSKDEVTLSVGKPATIEITSETDLGTIGYSGQGDFFSDISKTNIDAKKATISLTAKKPGTGTLVFSVAGFAATKSVRFTISPTLKFSDLRFSSATPDNDLTTLSPTNKGSAKPILQDETYSIRVTKIDNSKIPDDLLKATVEPAEAAKAEFKDGELKITGKSPKKGVMRRRSGRLLRVAAGKSI